MPTIANANSATKDEIRAVAVQAGAIAASANMAPNATAVANALAGKADILAAVEETGTAWSITESGHAYREVTGTNAAAITATFVFTGMVSGRSTGIIRQGGAGIVTLAGATIVYAPHLVTTQGNSPTTGSIRGFLVWVYRGGTTIEIVERSEDQNSGGGGGSGNAFSVVPAESGAAPTDANENLVLTVALPSAIPAGSTILITTLARFGLNTGNATPGTGTWLLKLNGTTVQSVSWIGETVTGIAAKMDTTVVLCHGAAAQASQRTGGAAGVTSDSIVETTLNTSGANTLTVYAQRFGATLTRPASIFVSAVTIKGA